MTDAENDLPEESDRPYRGEAGGPVSRALLPLMSYLLANLSVPFILLVFFVMNRTRVHGRHNVPQRRNTLLLSNHQSMIDSWLLTFSAFFPAELVRPYLLPWHPAAQENFFRNRFLAWLFTNFKCIPVRPGRRDVRAIHRSIQAIRGGTMIFFPEGTRTRDGSIGRGRPGAGLAALGTNATVVPVTIVGLDRVLPIGRKWPRMGNRVHVCFGRPIEYEDLAAEPPSREAAQQIVDRAMTRIRRQREAILRLERRSGR